MKYPTNERQTRRFQIRFAQKEQYFEAVSVFKGAKIPTIDAEKIMKQKSQLSQNGISGITHSTALKPNVHSAALPSPGMTTPDQAYHSLQENAAETTRSMRAPRPSSGSGPVIRDSMFPAHANPGAHRANQRYELKAFEESIQPNTSLLNNSVTKLGSSAPPSAVYGTQIYTSANDLRPSTAPAYDQQDLERDLPPERSLPFDKGSKQTPKLPRATRGVSELDEVPQHAAANLSERNPNLTAKKSAPAKGEILAKDIDTQLLLAKVEAKKKKSSNKRNSLTTKAGQNPVVSTKENEALKKATRNIRCLSCRSKKRKCERDPVNPQGTCVPCATIGQKCSFVADTDPGLPDDKTGSEPKVIHVQNSQVPAESKASQPLRISLRVKGIPPDLMPSQTADQNLVANSQPGDKRPSQLAMPAPKRVKRTSQDDVKHDKSQLRSKTKTNGSRKTDPQDARISTKSASATGYLPDPSEQIRSDATTMTATTLDLDPPPVSIANKGSNPSTKMPTVPTRSEAPLEQRQTHRSSSIAPICPPKTKPSVQHASEENAQEAQDTFKSLATSDISAVLTMNLDQQNKAIDSFFSVALFSDDFLELAKVVEHRWETGMFDSKV